MDSGCAKKTSRLGRSQSPRCESQPCHVSPRPWAITRLLWPSEPPPPASSVQWLLWVSEIIYSTQIVFLCKIVNKNIAIYKMLVTQNYTNTHRHSRRRWRVYTKRFITRFSNKQNVHSQLHLYSLILFLKLSLVSKTLKVPLIKIMQIQPILWITAQILPPSWHWCTASIFF